MINSDMLFKSAMQHANHNTYHLSAIYVIFGLHDSLKIKTEPYRGACWSWRSSFTSISLLTKHDTSNERNAGIHAKYTCIVHQNHQW